jgi:hypothetical protein
MLLQGRFRWHVGGVAKLIVFHHRFYHLFLMFSPSITKVVRRKHDYHECPEEKMASYHWSSSHPKSVSKVHAIVTSIIEKE